MLVIASRRKSQAPPPHIVWQDLSTPRIDGGRPWLELLDGEIEPRVTDLSRPRIVVWSSLWADRPADEIRFELEPYDGGTMLTWTLSTPDELPDPVTERALRHRLNKLINADLRAHFDC